MRGFGMGMNQSRFRLNGRIHLSRYREVATRRYGFLRGLRRRENRRPSEGGEYRRRSHRHHRIRSGARRPFGSGGCRRFLERKGRKILEPLRGTASGISYELRYPGRHRRNWLERPRRDIEDRSRLDRYRRRMNRHSSRRGNFRCGEQNRTSSPRSGNGLARSSRGVGRGSCGNVRRSSGKNRRKGRESLSESLSHGCRSR